MRFPFQFNPLSNPIFIVKTQLTERSRDKHWKHNIKNITNIEKREKVKSSYGNKIDDLGWPWIEMFELSQKFAGFRWLGGNNG